MKVRNTNIIEFKLEEQKAILHLTPSKNIIIDKDTLFCQQYMTGWSGYGVEKKDEHGNIVSRYISAKVARQIVKYLEYIRQDFNYDYYRMPFEKFTT